MSDSRSYFQLIEKLETLRDEPARVHRVSRFEAALARLTRERSLQLRPDAIVLVAGTNGKGSVSKTLETLLARPGRSIGLFTSPHMMETTERIRSEGRDLTRDEFVACFEAVEAYTEDLSHFEILTLMMAEAFFGGRIRRVVDFAILEVGVGGRLDPTRSFPHSVSVVTRIGLDHEELLGSTLTAIAREKIAIVDPGNDVIVAPLAPEALVALDERRLETPATYALVPEASFRIEHGGREPKWILRTAWGETPLALKGRRAAENSTLALHVLAALGEDVPSVLPRLAEIEWPCRMEGFEIDGRDVYLSGDHNAQGAASLVEILRAFDEKGVHFLVGLGRNKRIDDFMRELVSVEGAKFHLTRTPFRGGELERFGIWRDRALSVSDDATVGLKRAIEAAGPGELVVVTGSLYLTGDLRRNIVQGFFGETKPIK